MKTSSFILLIVSLAVFYGRGFVSPFEIGNNTIYFGMTYGLYWLMSVNIFLLIPRQWGTWFSSVAMGFCCLFAIETISQVFTRMKGLQPDNNIIAVAVYILISVAATLIYANQKTWREWTSGQN